MKSTVPVGTGEKVRAALDARGLGRVGYVSNPEFTAEGTAVDDFLHADRIVIGAFEERRRRRGRARCTRASTRRSCAPTSPRPRWSSSPSNAFLSTRISFINEIANVCELVGADVVDVARGAWASTTASASTSCARESASAGSCFPKDISALKQLAGNSGYHFQLLAAVIEVNELQKRRVVGKLETPPRAVAREADRAARARLQAGHGRHARGAEPRARLAAARRGRRGARLGPGREAGRSAAASTLCDSYEEAVADADAAVIVTEWPRAEGARRAPRCATRCAAR